MMRAFFYNKDSKLVKPRKIIFNNDRINFVYNY